MASFFRFHRGHRFATSALMNPISKTFVAALEEYARREKIPVIQFRKGQRKDDIAAEQRKQFRKVEGVVFIGKALPQPYSAYQISILQAEFSLTQVLDRAVTGRVLLEEVIRENLDIGRPSQVRLIFDRRVSRRTPGKFRTRVITDGVVPSPHADYKNNRIKQYHKQGRALRTETTLNNTRDFGIGKLLKNLPAPRQAGFQANRRLLDVQKISHDCSIGEDAFDRVVGPTEVEGQRAFALRFGDKRIQALFAVLVVFSLQLRGFNNQEMRTLLAHLLGLDPANYPPVSTHSGWLAHRAVLLQNLCRLPRPKLAEIMPHAPPVTSALRTAFDRLESEIDACREEVRLVA